MRSEDPLDHRFYGSARIPAPAEADALIAAATDDQQRAAAERLKAKSHYYTVAYDLARLASRAAARCRGYRHFVVCSGGGPVNHGGGQRGAHDEGAKASASTSSCRTSIAQSVRHSGTSFQFHYFALRKMHFLLRARAVAVFPGGFGTFDELFELLTLIQTGKVRPLPVLLFGREYWTRVINFQALVDEGVIAPHDLDLIHWCEEAAEAWEFVERFYAED